MICLYLSQTYAKKHFCQSCSNVSHSTCGALVPDDGRSFLRYERLKGSIRRSLDVDGRSDPCHVRSSKGI